MLLPLANTITPLITAQCAYLFVLNAIIGLLEGWLLKRLFRGGRRATWWMIVANYLSAWIGLFGLIWLIDRRATAFLGSRPIEQINRLAAVSVLIAFAFTIFVEVGFVHLATEESKRRLGRTVIATLCVNVISYGIICLWFLSISFTLPFNARVAQLADLGTLPQGTLYWVDPSGDVKARHFSGPEGSRVVGHVMLNDFVVPHQLLFVLCENPQRVQLDVAYATIQYAARPTPQNLSPPEPLVLSDAGPAAAFSEEYWNQSHLLRQSGLDLRPPEHRQTAIKFDWYRKYIRANVPDGPQSHLHVGFASIEWAIQEPTILPDDKVVFEWAGQIVLFDPHTQMVAFVASGICPAFIPDAK